MPKMNRKMAYGDAVALSNAYATITCKEDLANEVNSGAFPSAAYLSFVELELDTIAGGAASVTWFLSWDADGDRPFTPETTTTITIGKTTATAGGVAGWVDIEYQQPDDGVAGQVYVQAKLDVGTANGSARVYTRP